MAGGAKGLQIKVLPAKQTEMFDGASMILSGLARIDARCVNIAVPEDIGKAHDVLFFGVKGAGKEMAQVVWYFFRVTPDFSSAAR